MSLKEKIGNYTGIYYVTEYFWHKRPDVGMVMVPGVTLVPMVGLKSGFTDVLLGLASQLF